MRESRKHLHLNALKILLGMLVVLSFTHIGMAKSGIGNRQEGETVGAGEAPGYYCPPCGCQMDHIKYSAPGTCNYCSMPLLEAETGFVQTLRTNLAPIFQIGSIYSEYYVRLIYPLILFEVFLVIFFLINSKVNPKAIFFSVFLLSLSLYMLKFQLYGTCYALFSFESGVFFPISFIALTWPSLYFYFGYSVQNRKINRNDLLHHFSPAMVIWIAELILYLSYPWSGRFFYNGFETILIPIEQVIFIAGALFYGNQIYKLIWRNENQAVSSTERRRVLNISVFPAIFAFVLLVLLSINGFLYEFLVSTLAYHLLWLVMTISIPWYCYLILARRDELIKWTKPTVRRLSDEQLKVLMSRVEKIMEEKKPYLKQEFGLQDLAVMTGISKREMSDLLNNGFDSGFYDFVNHYRIREVKQMLIDPELNNFTNFAIAEKAGFKSKATFFSYFKKHVGMTPGEFKIYNQESNIGG